MRAVVVVPDVPCVPGAVLSVRVEKQAVRPGQHERGVYTGQPRHQHTGPGHVPRSFHTSPMLCPTTETHRLQT